MGEHFNRRDLLKFFGAGATIVPLVGGAPEMNAPARLIAEAKFEPVRVVEPNDFPPPVGSGDEVYVTMDYLAKDRMRYRFQARSFVIDSRCEIIPLLEFYKFGGPHVAQCYVPGRRTVEWAIRGMVVGEPSIQITSPRG